MFVPFFPFFCAVCLIFVVKSGYLAGIDALSAFRHEEDFDRRKADAEVLGEARLGDIHEVHQQLIVGSAVVLAVHLGKAGQAALTLQAQIELRQLPPVPVWDPRWTCRPSEC